MLLGNKNIIITGASSGIGFQLANELNRLGANLALISRREIPIPEFEQSCGKVIHYKCDVSDKDFLNSTLAKIKFDFSQIDIVILNAAITESIGIGNYSLDRAKYIFDVNFFAPVQIVEFFLSDFIKLQKGVFVGISSLADCRAFNGCGFYSASKAAFSLHLEGLRISLKPYNVKVITVKPGFVKTEMTAKNKFKMPFIISANKAAKIIIKGIAIDKTEIYFPFITRIITKIFKFMPNRCFEALILRTNKQL